MNFEDIKPFIRYASRLKPSPLTEEKELKSYDNCIVYAESGGGIICVDDEEYRMEVGSVLMWRANQRYRIHTSDQDTSYIFINFDFTNEKCITHSFKITPEPPDIFNPDRISDNTLFEDRTEFNKAVFLKSARQTEEMFLGIMSEFRRPKSHMNMRTSAKMIIILSEMSDAFKLDIPAKNPDKSDEIIEYIHQHYTNDLSNGDIARFFNFHPQHINKIVKKKTGYSLHKYVIMRRISKAIDLLETSKMPIAEIADKIGFQSVCHFSRYFKEFMGTSPRDYRQKTKV